MADNEHNCSKCCTACCKQFARRELPIILLILFLLQAIGFFLLYDYTQSRTGSLTQYHEAVYYIVYSQCIILALSSLCAALTVNFKHHFTCLSYFIRTSGLLIVLLGGIGTSFFFIPPSRGSVQEYFKRYYKDMDEPPKLVDKWQSIGNCCGLEGVVQDYLPLIFQYMGNSLDNLSSVTLDLPDSCCQIRTKGCGANITLSKVLPNGCFGPANDPNDADDETIKLPQEIQSELDYKFGWSVFLVLGAILLVVIFEVYHCLAETQAQQLQPIVFYPQGVVSHSPPPQTMSGAGSSVGMSPTGTGSRTSGPASGDASSIANSAIIASSSVPNHVTF